MNYLYRKSIILPHTKHNNYFQKDHSSRKKFRDFPDGAVVKNLPANAGDTRSSPGLGRSYMLRSN